MVPPFFFTLLIFTLLVTHFGRIEGMAAAPAASSLHGRKAQVTSPGTPGTNGGGWQWQGCGPSQCYREDYNQCFHSTSYECKNPPSLVQVTPPPTPRPVVQMIETENPILFRLINVADDYILSASDRARILSKIRALIDETLDESWELVSVESPGEYIGTRRLQSSLRGGNKRRLNKTLNIPVIVTVRGREDMSDMARLFILQALRNKLNLLLMYLKSLNANAYGSVQLSVEELNLADIGGPIADIGGPIVGPLPTLRPTYPPVQSTNTNTESKVETKTSVEATSVEATSPGTPSWVWVIAAAVCIAVGICLLWCICRAGWCLCCADCGGCFKRKRDTKNDYEMQKQLAIERWRQQPVHKKSNDDALGDLIGVSRYGKSNGGYEKRDVYESGRQSDRERRHGDRRRSAPVGGRGHGDRRRRDGKRRRSDGHVLSGNSNRNHQSDRRRPSRPVAKRSLSMIEKELAREEMDVIEEGMKVETERNEPVLAAPPAYPTVTHNQGQDPVAYQNALVVYDDEKARFTLEPEGPKIDDVPKPETAAVVLFNPPKEPEGGLAETPRRKPRNYHHDKDEIYVCSPDELPNYVRDKYGNHTERPQDLPRPSRRKRRSYTDKLKESFSFKRKEGQRNHDDFGDDYDGVQATLGTESDSESRERRRRKSKKKKKKKSNDRSSSHRRHESNGEDRPWIDIANESIPSITTTPPESDHQDDPASRSPRKRSSPRKRMSQSRLFSSFRRFKDGHDLEDLDDESVEHY